MPRVAVGMISHETNSFSPVATPLESFENERIGLLEGQDVVLAHEGTKTGIGGFLEVARDQGWEVVGTLAASATPSGNVEAEAYGEMKERLLAQLRQAMPVDAVLLHLHGAMLAKNAVDAEGDLAEAVREVVGPEVPILVELDLHGNITREFCDVVNGVFAYHTNPHIDPYERGLEAAGRLVEILNGTLPTPHVYISKPPMLPATINMRTGEGPMQKLTARARELEQRPGIVNVSVFGGFPYADFDRAGTAIVVTANDSQAGQAAADELGREAWNLREEFLKDLPDVKSAVDQALRLVAEGGEGPVVLADVADNPGGGGSGDTTELLRELVRRGAQGAVACIYDPETVRQASELGVGQRGRFRIGGKVAPEAYGAPVEVRGVVRQLTDGHFVGQGPVVRGRPVECGPTACIDVNGLKLVVTSVRHAANDRGYFRQVGIEPEQEPLLVIKSRGHFRADFEPIARTIIEVDAPGAANPNLDRFQFQHVRRPIWPLDRDAQWEVAEQG